MVDVDTVAARCYVHSFIWKDSLFREENTTEAPFIQNPARGKSYYQNSPAFKRELLELGAAFTHPAKPTLNLEDLFIYPDLLTHTLLQKASRTVSSQNVLEFVKGLSSLTISGPPLSGKTSLAKKLYLDLQDRFNLIPILLQGEDLRGNPKSAARNTTNREFQRQYPDSDLEEFIQLESARKALIVDDWHLARFNSAAKNTYLSEVRARFGLIITLTADGIWLQEILEADEDAPPEFVFCDIKEFGYHLRGQLVRQWFSLGQDFETDELELAHKIESTEHMLDSVIGRGTVPSYPFFILYALQVSELDSQKSVTHGSYGHVYEALITERLASVSEKATDLGTKYTYLSLLAFRLFSSDKRALTPDDFRDVHAEFERDYEIPLDRQLMLDQLQDAKILGQHGENITFLHKYCYYYFVAKYFQKALANKKDDEPTLRKLSQMVEMVHDEEYMNILIFYVYLTEDRKLIEYIITNARKIYDEHRPCDLDKDVEFVSALNDSRTVDLDSSNVDKNREEFRQRQDHIEATAPPQSERSLRTAYDQSLADVVKTDFAFRSLQVMGQVLRNFPGDLRADLKFELAQESFLLAFRALQSFLTTIQKNLPAFQAFIERNLLRYQAKPGNQTSSEAAKVLSFFAQAAIFGMVKRASHSVGLEDLRETYEAVRRTAGEHDIPTQLVTLSIKLDNFTSLPLDEIEDLVEELKNKAVAGAILRILVAEHLHLFPVHYKDRQRLAGIFKFDTSKQLAAPKKVRRDPADN